MAPPRDNGFFDEGTAYTEHGILSVLFRQIVHDLEVPPTKLIALIREYSESINSGRGVVPRNTGRATPATQTNTISALKKPEMSFKVFLLGIVRVLGVRNIKLSVRLTHTKFINQRVVPRIARYRLVILRASISYEYYTKLQKIYNSRQLSMLRVARVMNTKICVTKHSTYIRS